MLALSCSLCRHVNPPGSKFCNECGSPLRLTPCLQCDAVNDVGSATCHQCGAPSVPKPVAPRPFANRATSFEERIDALRRDFGILRGLPLATRPAAPVATRSSSMAPAPSSTPDEPLRPAPASSIVPAAPSNPAPASFTTTAATAAADHGQRVASPPGLATVRPAVPAPAEPRTVPPRLLYVLGAGLILVGLAVYTYSVYGPPDRIEQWLGALRRAPLAQGHAVEVPPQSIARAVDPTTAPSSSGAAKAGVPSWTDDVAMTAPGATAPSSSVPMSDATRHADAIPASAQTAAPTIAEPPASSLATQAPPATASATADASDAPPVAAASKKHAPRAKRRAGTRKTAPSHSEIAPRVPIYIPAVDTR
jgi:hypothetical protein